MDKRETHGNVVRMHDKLKELNNRLNTQNTLHKEKVDRNIDKIELLERRIQQIAEQAAKDKVNKKVTKPLPF